MGIPSVDVATYAMTASDIEFPRDSLLSDDFAHIADPAAYGRVPDTAPAPLQAEGALQLPINEQGMARSLDELLELLSTGRYRVLPLESMALLGAGVGRSCLVEALNLNPAVD